MSLGPFAPRGRGVRSRRPAAADGIARQAEGSDLLPKARAGVSRRLYRLLLRALPLEFRRRFGAGMEVALLMQPTYATTPTAPPSKERPSPF